MLISGGCGSGGRGQAEVASAGYGWPRAGVDGR